MSQRSESGVSARYETKVFSLWDPEPWGEAPAFTYEILLRVFEWPCKVEG